jgi:hypothetical protein
MPVTVPPKPDRREWIERAAHRSHDPCWTACTSVDPNARFTGDQMGQG